MKYLFQKKEKNVKTKFIKFNMWNLKKAINGNKKSYQ